MKLKLIVAALLIAAVPVCAQAQDKPAPKPTKADAERVVKMIGGDKAKTATYCEIAKLSEEADQAEQKKDSKKAEALYNKMDGLSEKLGSEYGALMEGLQELEPDSKPAQEIGAVLESLDKLCEK